VDFIDFQWWPVFNIADIGVVVGGFLLVWLLSESADSAPGDGVPGDSDDDDRVISTAPDNEASQ
jgi:signal peptidase II